MQHSPTVTIDGATFRARPGEVLLDAALKNGIAIPSDCRAGHCGTCCVRLVSGTVQGGEAVEPGIVHACQCRIVGDVEIEQSRPGGTRSIEGVLRAIIPLSSEVYELRVETTRMFPYHAGQYAQLQFKGFPSRPFSITHPLRGSVDARMVSFHVRRMQNGIVTGALGRDIRLGHRVTLTGPLGSAHFRPEIDSRLVLVATSTGFAPIWSIAVAALHENPWRSVSVVAGGRGRASLYMGPALAQLARFPNVDVTLACSAHRTPIGAVQPGRPTDYLPMLSPNDVVYACGAPSLVEAVRAIATRAGAVCYADPFMTMRDGAVQPPRPVANATAHRRPSTPRPPARREPSLPQFRSF